MTIPNLMRRAAGRARRTLQSRPTPVARLESDLRAQQDRIDELQLEIDELRRDSLRVAELIDLAEQAFTPKP
ncbi:hypothetical protein [Leucobacter sp. USHLN153]|uniref:hypothetical protein n=1 Tax=Leucobacter sp. USHLN153 TaxID=3081268 RepID=UPI0030162558